MARRVDKWCDPDCQNPECMDVRMPRKLYILVPDSCFCPRTLESSGPEGSIVFGGHLEDLVRTTAGSVDRVYKHTVWNIQRQNGEVGGTKSPPHHPPPTHPPPSKPPLPLQPPTPSNPPPPPPCVCACECVYVCMRV